ncbi:MAG: FG-GAP-like repeat-containing protein [Planctomycetota bacterium]
MTSTHNTWPARAPAALAILLLATSLCSLLFLPRLSNRSAVDVLEAARVALNEDQLDDALAAAEYAVRRWPELNSAWLLLGNVNEARQDFEGAIAAYDHVSEISPATVFEARLASGAICLNRLHLLSRAERYFLAAYQAKPGDPRAAQSLARILGICGRSREQIPFLLDLIQHDQFSNFHLYAIVAGKNQKVDPDLLAQCYQADLADVEVQVAAARLELIDGHLSRAHRSLSSVINEYNHPRALALMGQILLTTKAPDDDFESWIQKARRHMDTEPDIWRVMGERERLRGNQDSSIRYLAETLRRNPMQPEVAAQLGHLLQQTEHSRLAGPLLTWAHRLHNYNSMVEVANSSGNIAALKQTVEQAQSLGLLWEAYGWCQMALRRTPESGWARSRLHSLRKAAEAGGRRRCILDSVPVEGLDTLQFPLTPSGPTHRHTTATESPSPASPANIRFQDDAVTSNVHFQYHNGGNVKSDGLRRMYEFTGGGIAILDFDMDLYPDLYFSQGCPWQDRGTSQAPLDAVYRNLDAAGFADVTLSSTIAENEFSQGVAAGDIDNDGFPDLAVSNAGLNRLFRNNGDGTFSELPAVFPDEPASWSTSCLIADLNADSIPDIYFVNYLAGADVFERTCPDAAGKLRLTCRPQQFSASPDNLYLGTGDGQFVDASASSGIVRPNGRGMGAAAATLPTIDASAPNTLSLIVANDSSCNFHFSPVAGSEHSGSFEDRALFSGLAVNGSGRAEACMGIAVDDINGDRQLDLFFTNFAGETNTLYVQQNKGMFSDMTEQFNLGASSLKMLGFGTAFLDADLDSFSDLVIANGHVNDVRSGSTMFQMPAQFYRNQSGQGFVELTRQDSPGPYFQRMLLGRSLAVLDWNRDGRPDIIVSHLDEPAALLTNQSAPIGSWLQVRVIGTTGTRDALGTQITVSADRLHLTKQLIGGSSYQASHERSVTFGLGTVTAPVDLTVTWPSGRTSSINQVLPNQSVTIVAAFPDGPTIPHTHGAPHTNRTTE